MTRAGLLVTVAIALALVPGCWWVADPTPPEHRGTFDAPRDQVSMALLDIIDADPTQIAYRVSPWEILVTRTPRGAAITISIESAGKATIVTIQPRATYEAQAEQLMRALRQRLI